MTIPPPPKTPNIWKTLAIVLLVVVIIMGAIVGILSANLLSTNQGTPNQGTPTPTPSPTLTPTATPTATPQQTGTGTNNQVQVSGTVPDRTSGTLYFANLDGTFQTSTSITNGEYSVLLVGGQSYTVSHISSVGHIIDNTFYPYINYNEFYVPLGVTTFTENLVPTA
jgi:hypothetical protein